MSKKDKSVFDNKREAEIERLWNGDGIKKLWSEEEMLKEWSEDDIIQHWIESEARAKQEKM